MPDNHKDRIILCSGKCKQWYHNSCEQIDGNIWNSRLRRYCRKCKKWLYRFITLPNLHTNCISQPQSVIIRCAEMLLIKLHSHTSLLLNFEACIDLFCFGHSTIMSSNKYYSKYSPTQSSTATATTITLRTATDCQPCLCDITFIISDLSSPQLCGPRF